MKAVKVNCLDLDWEIPGVPETAEEYDKIAGRQGACVQDAVNKELYHGTFGEIRSRFTDALDNLLKSDKMEDVEIRKANGLPAEPTTISWDSTTVEDTAEDGTVTYKQLGEAAWLNKTLAKLNKKVTDLAFLQARVQVKFDPTSKPRVPAGPKTPSKGSLAAADALLLNHGKEVQGKLVDASAIANKLAELNPEDKSKVKLEIDEKTNLPKRESLARLIQANEARKRAEENLATKYADATALV